MVVLDDDLALGELLELGGVEIEGLVLFVALGVEELCGAFGAGAFFDDAVDLALPASAEEGFDGVLSAYDPSGFEVEGIEVVFVGGHPVGLCPDMGRCHD